MSKKTPKEETNSLFSIKAKGIKKSRTRAASPIIDIGEDKRDAGLATDEDGLSSRSWKASSFSDSEDLSADEEGTPKPLTRSVGSPIALRAMPVLYTPSSHAPAHAKRRQKRAAGKATSPEPSILDFLSKQDKGNSVESRPLNAEMKKLGYEPLAPNTERDGTLKFSNGPQEVASISQKEDGNYQIKIKKGPALVAINLKDEHGAETDKQIVISYNEKGEVDKIIPSEATSQQNGPLKTKDGLIIPLSEEDYAIMKSQAEEIDQQKLAAKAQERDISLDEVAPRKTRVDRPRNRDAFKKGKLPPAHKSPTPDDTDLSPALAISRGDAPSPKHKPVAQAITAELKESVRVVSSDSETAAERSPSPLKQRPPSRQHSDSASDLTDTDISPPPASRRRVVVTPVQELMVQATPAPKRLRETSPVRATRGKVAESYIQSLQRHQSQSPPRLTTPPGSKHENGMG